MLIEDLPVKFVAKTLNIHENSIYKWISDYEKFGEQAFPGRGSRNFVTQSKINELEKENELLKEELSLLKKYGCFSEKIKISL